MHTPKSTHIFATGLAMFSMFFGAGNIVFPLALGQYAQDQSLFALIGLLITAVGVPFIGLIAMTLYHGDYKRFFERIGVVPGFCLTALILGLLGPFGSTPRCITLSFSTAKMIFPELSLPYFSIGACVLIFLFTFQKNRIIHMLGYVLTPLLLGSLALIIVKGWLAAPDMPVSSLPSMDAFLTGLQEGYQTMDLLAAFFFSSVVIASLRHSIPESSGSHKNLVGLTLKASCIGALLLSLTYVGFCTIAAHHSLSLADVSKDKLLGTLALQILGPSAGLIACLAVTMACLTTAIALASIFAQFINRDVSLGKIGYVPALIGTLVATYFVSTLDFNGIVIMLAPILEICYPALIVLSIVNISYKLLAVKKEA